jgi:enoyl-CoA hydratase/carnithine racemase
MAAGTIGLTELLVGVPFPTVPLEIMRHAAGPAAGLLALTGRPVDAAEAHRLGLVDLLLEGREGDVLAAAVGRAEALAAIPAAAYARTKRQLHAPARDRIDALREAEDGRTAAMWQDPATLERIGGYLDGLGSRAGR